MWNIRLVAFISGVLGVFLLSSVAAADGGYWLEVVRQTTPQLDGTKLNSDIMIIASPDTDPWLFVLVVLTMVTLGVCAWAIGKVAEYFRTREQTKLDRLQRAWENVEEDRKAVEENRKASEREKNRLAQEIDQQRRELAVAKRSNDRDREAVLKLAEEKSEGFPWLAQTYAEYFERTQLKFAGWLERKKWPAPKSAETVREIARARRAIERKLRVAQGIIKYWESLFPFLEDLLGEPDQEVLRKILAQNIEQPIREVADLDVDPVRLWLSREEYEKLSPAERNQRALDIYRARRKSKWQIGRDYERYIGYLHERDRYSVYYQGILEGYDDLGRDLIAKKADGTLIIQCKCWSRHKQIHEKHVNQLFGTSVKYVLDHHGDRVVPVLYTSTELTDRARQFAEHLGVQVKEGFPLKDYPSVKCNVSRATGERIYHLPFDQQYDTTQIEPSRGECYVETVAEAEALGFRRAWRWHGEDAGAE